MLVKTHLITTGQEDKYDVKWCGRLIDTNPKFTKEGILRFIVITKEKRVEINSTDIFDVAEHAKRLTHPRGRESITKDKAHIYVLEKDDKETLLGVVEHTHIRHYSPMYDDIPID